jgi:hypothetical protein
MGDHLLFTVDSQSRDHLINGISPGRWRCFTPLASVCPYLMCLLTNDGAIWFSGFQVEFKSWPEPESAKNAGMLRAPKSPERQWTPSCFIQTSKYFFFFSVFSESYLTSGQRYQGNIFLSFHTKHQFPDGQSLLFFRSYRSNILSKEGLTATEKERQRDQSRNCEGEGEVLLLPVATPHLGEIRTLIGPLSPPLSHLLFTNTKGTVRIASD